MDKSDVYLLLWSIEGVGYETIRKIEEDMGDAAKILEMNRGEINKIEYLPGKVKKNIIKNANSSYLKNVKQKIDEYGMEYVAVNEKRYPDKLREIYDPPYVLFVKGNAEILNNFSIAMVGSRRATGYGAMCARKFAGELSKEGVTIVSGMAFGIDAYSHEASMKEEGKTIAVLGSSLDRPYPAKNLALMKSIIENGGAVISEYPPETDAIPGFFPMRNRIISGLSNGVLVVEAAKRSGSLITMEYALEQGKNVFAVPGNINSKMSEGTNGIIKEGAKPVISSSDILEEYDIKKNRYKKELKEDLKLSKLEKDIVEILKTNGSMHADEVCVNAGMSIKDTLGVLNILQIKGIVLELGGNIYSINI